MTPEEIEATAAELVAAHVSVGETEKYQPLFAKKRKELALRLHEEAGWSQTAIAKHLGITRGRVHQILHGNQKHVRKEV